MCFEIKYGKELIFGLKSAIKQGSKIVLKIGYTCRKTDSKNATKYRETVKYIKNTFFIRIIYVFLKRE